VRCQTACRSPGEGRCGHNPTETFHATTRRTHLPAPCPPHPRPPAPPAGPPPPPPPAAAPPGPPSPPPRPPSPPRKTLGIPLRIPLRFAGKRGSVSTRVYEPPSPRERRTAWTPTSPRRSLPCSG